MELENEAKRLEKRRKRFLSSAEFALGNKLEYGQKETLLNLHSRLTSLSRNLLSQCLIIRVEDYHSVKAMQRVRRCVAPARKGKQEAKDCEILEAFLDLSESILDKGFDQALCFVSSNSDDYGKPGRSPIEEEFKNNSVKYVSNLQWSLAIAENRA